jgi:hypothetical protein
MHSQVTIGIVLTICPTSSYVVDVGSLGSRTDLCTISQYRLREPES